MPQISIFLSCSVSETVNFYQTNEMIFLFKLWKIWLEQWYGLDIFCTSQNFNFGAQPPTNLAHSRKYSLHNPPWKAINVTSLPKLKFNITTTTFL